MPRHKSSNEIFLAAIDFLIILLCLTGVYLIMEKQDLPFKLTTFDDFLIIKDLAEESQSFQKGDKIIGIDSIKFSNWEEVELYLDGQSPGSEVRVDLIRGEEEYNFNVELVAYYSTYEIVIVMIVGGLFILFGIIVRLKAPENESAQIFHLATLGLGSIIILTPGNFTVLPFYAGYIMKIIWLAAYSFTPVMFIHFTHSFTNKGIVGFQKILKVFYAISIIFTLLLSYLFLDVVLNNHIKSIISFIQIFSQFFRPYVIICIVTAISICIYAYKKTQSLEERKKLRWLLLGFFIGPLSYAVFWEVPLIITGHSMISETNILLLLISIPITFSIAIVKHQLMDINFIIQRSIIYALLLMGIIIIYIALTSFLSLFIININPALPSVLTAFTTVILLNPVKNYVKHFVDKKFFKVEYDYRTELENFLTDIKESTHIQELADKIVHQTNELIPVDNIGFFILSKPDNRIKMIANQGWALLKGRSLQFEEENLKTNLSLPVAVDDKVEPGLKIEKADIKVFKRWGMVLVFPVKSPTGIIHAFFALGEKKVGARYLKDDVDLLTTVSSTAAIALDRLLIQEELLREKVEAERLEVLNRMKSFFVSTVSHDLKTPLTSIKMFTELLQNKLDSQNEKASEYLTIINGESDKLRRLIENILDFTKIEQGMKSYDLEQLELNELVCKVVKDIEYQVNMAKQKIIIADFGQKIYIDADPNAVERAVLNLITNSIKYSSPEATTRVSIVSEDKCVGIRVQDQGRGINKEKLDKIFEPFFRSDDEKALKAEGTGLGLAIVKHIMDSHNGKIQVESEIAKGSIFTLWFPKVKDA